MVFGSVRGRSYTIEGAHLSSEYQPFPPGSNDAGLTQRTQSWECYRVLEGGHVPEGTEYSKIDQADHLLWHRRARHRSAQPEDQQPKRRLSQALPQRTIPRALNFRDCRDGRAFLFSQGSLVTLRMATVGRSSRPRVVPWPLPTAGRAVALCVGGLMSLSPCRHFGPF